MAAAGARHKPGQPARIAAHGADPSHEDAPDHDAGFLLRAFGVRSDSLGGADTSQRRPLLFRQALPGSLSNRRSRYLKGFLQSLQIHQVHQIHQILQNVPERSEQMLESRIATVRVFRVAERTERRASIIEQLIDRPTTGSGLNGCRRQSKTLPECPPFSITEGKRIHTVGLYRKVRLACRLRSETP